VPPYPTSHTLIMLQLNLNLAIIQLDQFKPDGYGSAIHTCVKSEMILNEHFSPEMLVYYSSMRKVFLYNYSKSVSLLVPPCLQFL